MTDGFWIGFRVVSPLREPSEAEKEKYWDCDDPSFRRIVRERAFYRHEVFPEARETRRYFGGVARPLPAAGSARTFRRVPFTCPWTAGLPRSGLR